MCVAFVGVRLELCLEIVDVGLRLSALRDRVDEPWHMAPLTSLDELRSLSFATRLRSSEA
jgi:hypothetical protein